MQKLQDWPKLEEVATLLGTGGRELLERYVEGEQIVYWKSCNGQVRVFWPSVAMVLREEIDWDLLEPDNVLTEEDCRRLLEESDGV